VCSYIDEAGVRGCIPVDGGSGHCDCTVVSGRLNVNSAITKQTNQNAVIETLKEFEI
jgi:hypothetical protein